jgi:hypothetical protein
LLYRRGCLVADVISGTRTGLNEALALQELICVDDRRWAHPTLTGRLPHGWDTVSWLQGPLADEKCKFVCELLIKLHGLAYLPAHDT